MSSIHDLDTPALLVDADKLERNIHYAAEVARAGGKRLRPHTKTHKTAEIARLQIAAGATGLTVAKLGEAEVFADAGLTHSRGLFPRPSSVAVRVAPASCRLRKNAGRMLALLSADYFRNIGSSALPELRIYARRSFTSFSFSELIRPGGIIEVA